MSNDEPKATVTHTESADTALESLAKRLIRRARTLELLRFVGLFAAGGAAAAAVLLVASAAGIVRVSLPQLLTAYAAVLLVSAVVSAVRSRMSRARALLDADIAYETAELLSTAYGELRRHPHSPFTATIAAHAKAVAGTVAPRRVYRIRRIRPLLIPAAIALVALSAVAMGWIAPAMSVPLGDRQLAERLEKLGSRLAAESRAADDESGRELARELQALGDQLSRGRLNDRSRERARSALPRIEEQIDALSRSPLPEATQRSERLAEAEEMLRGMLVEESRSATRLGFAGSRGEGAVNRNGGGGGRDRANDAEQAQGESDAAERGDEGGAGERSSSAAVPNGEGSVARPGDDGNAGRPSDGGAGERTSGGDGGERAAPGAGGAANGSGTRGSDERAGGVSGGGDAPAEQSENEAEQLEAVPGNRTPSRLEGEIGDGDVIRLYVRRLAEEAVSGLPDTAISESYATSVESAIRREQVPPRAESLVRDYFVFLGITQREQGEENAEAQQ